MRLTKCWWGIINTVMLEGRIIIVLSNWSEWKAKCFPWFFYGDDFCDFCILLPSAGHTGWHTADPQIHALDRTEVLRLPPVCPEQGTEDWKRTQRWYDCVKRKIITSSEEIPSALSWRILTTAVSHTRSNWGETVLCKHVSRKYIERLVFKI